MDHMAIQRIREPTRLLFDEINDLEEVRKGSAESFNTFHDAVQRLITSDDYHREKEITLCTEVMMHLAKHTNDALVNDSDYFEELIQVLASQTTSWDIWRRFFGVGSDTRLHPQSLTDDNFDCVLEVARKVCTLIYQTTTAAVSSSLKIIANCCADNNLNRRFFIHRGGIETLIDLAQHDADTTFLVPALFNVCVDYDEEATFSDTQSALEGHELAGEGKQKLALSVERLASACRSGSGFMTFELLLSLWPKVPINIQPYLAELIEMATQPAIHDFRYICMKVDHDRDPWTWTFFLNGVRKDTVALALEFASQGPEYMSYICRTFLNVLSQNAAIDALLARDDSALWEVFTLACRVGDPQTSQKQDPNEDQDAGEASDPGEDPSLAEYIEELIPARKAFLKLLYQITGRPDFSENETRASALIEKCASNIQDYVNANEHGHITWTQVTSGSCRSMIVATACVIVSQLMVSHKLRHTILNHHQPLLPALFLLLEHEINQDVLYPAITIISRLALVPSPELTFAHADAFHKMQRLLISSGLGLMVPLETVTAFKTIVRGRPSIIGLLLSSGRGNQTILADTISLWKQTVEGTTRLEIGKFFLEILRTILTEQSQEIPASKNQSDTPLERFKQFLQENAMNVAEILAWVCTKAEPRPQQDHGWFGLAMLSTFSEGGVGILRLLEQDSEMIDAILATSQIPEGAVRNNLMLMLSKLQAFSADNAVSHDTKNTLRQAANNLKLNLSP